VFRAYSVLRCRDWCRIDARLDAGGRPHILELNPLPDFAPSGRQLLFSESGPGRGHELQPADQCGAGYCLQAMRIEVMKHYDCVILYNPSSISGSDCRDEKLYPANIFREEVNAIEESLRRGLSSIRAFRGVLLPGPGPDAERDFSQVRLQSLRRDEPEMRVRDVCGGPA